MGCFGLENSLGRGGGGWDENTTVVRGWLCREGGREGGRTSSEAEAEYRKQHLLHSMRPAKHEIEDRYIYHISLHIPSSASLSTH